MAPTRMMIKAKFLVQVVFLNLSYRIAKWRRTRATQSVEWVVGTAEIASMVHSIARSLPNSFSIVVNKHPFYSHRYDWEPKSSRIPGFSTFQSLILLPALFGALAAQARGFVYVGNSGFLNPAYDQREYEFKFLKRSGCRVICYFTGTDIRSIEKMRELERESGVPNFGTYLPEVAPALASAAFEESRRRVAQVADEFADHIFSAVFDQRGYLTRDVHPYLYFHSDRKVATSTGKFRNLSRPVILHASSSPVIKGTQLVRAAISQLREEGFEFEYVELLKVPHEVVETELNRAHIVLNQFYSSMPGVFGIEAMASGCVLVTSASQASDSELQLPADSNDAWVVTAHYQVTDNLRQLLLNPSMLESQAQAGLAWVRKHATASVSARKLLSIIEK